MKTPSLTTMTTIAIGVTVLLLVHIGNMSVSQCFRRLEDTSLSQQRLSALTLLGQVKYSLQKLERYEHAFVSSGSEKDLDLYNRESQNLSQQVGELDIHLHGKHRMLADEIREYIRVRKECADEVIALKKSKGTQEAERHSVQLGEDMVTKHIEVMVDELGNQADIEFKVRASDLDMRTYQTVAGITLLMAVALVILVVVVAVVNKYVNERQKAELSLRNAERRFRAVFNQTFQFSGLLSNEGLVLEANQTALEFARIDIQAVKDRPFWDTPWWRYSQEVQDRLKAAVTRAATGEMVRFEAEVEGIEGRAAVDFSVKPIKEEDGTVIFLIAEARDITERVKAEEAVAEREARMRAIVDTAPDGILTVNSDGSIESVNPALERMLGFESKELTGKDVNMILPSLLSGGEKGPQGGPMRTGERRVFGVGREFFGIKKDGQRVPLEVSLSVIKLGSQQIFTGIVRDITERKEAEQRVKEFYSTVSHELRTPLTAIRTALGIMESSFLPELGSKAKPVIDIASKEADRLIRLINDILDIRKIEAGKLDLKLRKLDPIEIVGRAVSSLDSLIQQAGVKVETKSEATARVIADEDRLQQVITNILSNAIKWSPENGVVTILVNECSGKCRFEIHDEGPGIAENEISILFDRFQQGSARDERSRGGTGLGLAIAKAIVEQHGGEIGVETGNGKAGSRFWFELPLSKN